MPEVSIVIPTYNAEKTILETVESALAQTFTDFEILVINDGSTDSTLNLIEEIGDARLKIFNYENSGVAIARNRGISLAAGQFISFLDSDDLWLPDKLESQLFALKNHPAAGLAYSWVSYINTQGDFLYSQEPIYYEGNVYPQLLARNFLTCGSTPLIRKHVIDSVGGFDPSVPPADDWDYWLRVSEKWNFKVVTKHQVLYRISPHSMSLNVEAMERAHMMVLEKAFESAPAQLQPLKKKNLSYYYQYLAALYLDRDTKPERFKLGGHKLLKAIQSDPEILLDKLTQRLLRKWLIMRFIPPTIAKYLM